MSQAWLELSELLSTSTRNLMFKSCGKSKCCCWLFTLSFLFFYIFNWLYSNSNLAITFYFNLRCRSILLFLRKKIDDNKNYLSLIFMLSLFRYVIFSSERCLPKVQCWTFVKFCEAANLTYKAQKKVRNCFFYKLI